VHRPAATDRHEVRIEGLGTVRASPCSLIVDALRGRA
jgi:hypothetical protein